FNPVTKYYAAPAQLKANNGLLIVDDFGRQRVSPEELLNRWVAPLDRGIDFLTLAGGKKIEIPFDVLVAFATNLDPATLVDEAFLRRIQTKIRLGSVTREHFHEICRRVCAQNKLHYDHGLIEELIDTIATDLARTCAPATRATSSTRCAGRRATRAARRRSIATRWRRPAAPTSSRPAEPCPGRSASG